jgi:hypothetical protein
MKKVLVVLTVVVLGLKVAEVQIVLHITKPGSIIIECRL